MKMISWSILLLLFGFQPAAVSAANNSRNELLGKTITCGAVTINFDRRGGAVVREGNKVTLRGGPNEVFFERNGFTIIPDGAQDVFKLSYRFGEFVLDRTPCEVR